MRVHRSARIPRRGHPRTFLFIFFFSRCRYQETKSGRQGNPLPEKTLQLSFAERRTSRIGYRWPGETLRRVLSPEVNKMLSWLNLPFRVAESLLAYRLRRALRPHQRWEFLRPQVLGERVA